MTHEYGLLEPLALVTVPVVLLTLAIMIRGVRLQRATAQALGVESRQRPCSFYTLVVLMLLLLGGALLRPHWGFEDITVQAPANDIVFLIDVSRSMYARDVPPSRMELAKRKIKDAVYEMTRQGRAGRFAITIFSGDGFTLCPLTSDITVVRQFVDMISPDLVTSLGSDLEAGIRNALSRFEEQRTGNLRIVLISDGEDSFLDQTKVIEEIKAKGIRLDVLGVGTPAGTTVVLPSGAPLLDSARKPVVSVLQEDVLRRIAEAGGGTYARASLDDRDIRTISTTTGMPRLSKTAAGSTVRNYRECGPWLILVVLVLVLVSAANRRINPFLGCIICMILFSEPAQAAPLVDHLLSSSESIARELYERGEFTQAADEFSKALSKEPDNRALKRGLAKALFKSGRHSDSRKLFKELADTASSGRDYFDNLYNEANALLAMKEYQAAIDTYTRALEIKEDDPQALHNREVARALLEEQSRSAQRPSPTPTLSPTVEPSSAPTPNQAPSPTVAAPTPQQPATPTPASDASTSPSASESPVESPQPSQSPEHSESATPGADMSATAAPSADSSSEQVSTSTPSASDTATSPSAGDIDQSTPPVPTPASNEQAPEVDAWLQSIPEAPLPLRRFKGRSQHGGQTW